MSKYIELHTASAFSFLQGASLPEALVERAAELGYPALALVDRDGVYGAPRFHKAALAAGIRPIIGAELTIAGPSSFTRGRESRLEAEGQRSCASAGGWGPPRDKESRESTLEAEGVRSSASAGGWGPPRSKESWLLPVLCESQEGYRNLSRLITTMKLRAPKGEGALALEELEGLTRGLVAVVGRAVLDVGRYGVGGQLDRAIGLFGRDHVYVELQRHFRRAEEADNQALLSLAAAFRVPVIATGGVRFATSAERPLFDVLTCMHHHTTLARAGRRLAPNAERYLKAPAKMAALFSDVPEAVARTYELADRLQYTMADLGYRFPDYPVPPGETQTSFLRQIAEIGARDRYRPYHDRARAQIARELDLIEKLSLAGYFLIVWDIVNFCRQHDILVQGRGSAANSAVCYSLGITAVDPVGMDLLFERFLSEERGEWPDIDLDLPSGDRRERVIQHVYEKYGRLGAAMTANVITYRGRSAAREVGKALGFEPSQIDRLAKVMNNFEFTDPADTLPRHLAAVGLDLNTDRVRLFARLWGEMQDLPRHLGQHSGGMVICQGELDACVPLENASMPGRVVVQWDKDDCADMGIVKVDLLGLGMMAVIQDALALVNGETTTINAEAADNGLEQISSAISESFAQPFPKAERLGSRPRECEALPARDSLEPLRSAQALSNSAGGGAPPFSPEAESLGTKPRASQVVPAHDSLEPLRSAKTLSNSAGGGAPPISPEAESLRSRPRTSEALPGRGGGAPRQVKKVDLAHLPDDPAVYRLLQEADTIGVFQVESRAQMATLPRLKPACFYDIVVQVAIIRPGPIVGQMVHPYLNRRAGREPVRYPHPSLEPILARTLGVPLFQEQLLRMAMVAAGFTGGQAEDLRRAFGFKRSERRMKQVEVQLREGMARQGIAGEAAEQIVTSIASFALYGFPESHAASFALLAYASAFLKVHYPAAFYTALLNNQPMGFYHPSTLVKDAQRRGVRFHPIDAQVSDWDCTVEPDGAIRLGLRYVSGLRQEVGKKIATASADTRGRESTLEAEGVRRPASAGGWGPPRSKECRESTLERSARGPGEWGWGPTSSKEVFSARGWGPARSKGSGVPQLSPEAESLRSRPRDSEAVPARGGGAPRESKEGPACPKCGCDDESMLERVDAARWFCNTCSHDWPAASAAAPRRFASVDDLVARTGLRRDELVTLADVGALNSFGYDRRSALWQAERAVRPSGELFATINAESAELAEHDVVLGDIRARESTLERSARGPGEWGWGPTSSKEEADGHFLIRVGPHPHALADLRTPSASSPDTRPRGDAEAECPLRPMTEAERLVADYAGTGLTVGRHPMALRRDELAMRGVLRASDLRTARQGRRVRIAGMVITRQRPGTAKGFVFLTLEDETGIANIIVRPDLFARDRLVIVEEPFLIVEGVLQNQDGVTSVRAEHVQGMRGVDVDFDAHDFY